MGARHRGGIGFSYRPARLHRLAEFIPWHQFRPHKHLKVRAQTMTLLHSFAGGGQDFVDTIIAVKLLLKG
jgi:hypothetical protein